MNWILFILYSFSFNVSAFVYLKLTLFVALYETLAKTEEYVLPSLDARNNSRNKY